MGFRGLEEEGCIRFFISVIKYLPDTNQGRKDLFVFTVSGGSVYRGGKGISEQNGSASWWPRSRNWKLALS